jgi:putative ABC transport system ATP-binding protein
MMFTLNNVIFKNLIRYPPIQIRENAATFITGESGCGKSTLLKLLNGVVSADDGEIFYDGKPIEEYNPVFLRQQVLLCGQTAFLFNGSIQDNFEQFYKYRDLTCPAPHEIQQYLKICAAEFPLCSICTTMSGGERQRIFTAICLSLKPRVLMLDEPTSALDDKTSNSVIFNIKSFCQEHAITLIIVSHNSALAVVCSDHIITLARDDIVGQF